MSNRTRYISHLMEIRAKRMFKGWLKIGIVLGVIQFVSLFNMGLIAYWQLAGTIVYFTTLGWLYWLRSRSVSQSGTLMITELSGKEFPFGIHAVPPVEAPVPFNIASVLWKLVLAVFGNMLPTRIIPFYLHIKGKQRYADLWLFKDESPVITEDNKILCVVATDLWFYPPSPWVVCSQGNEPDSERRQLLVNSFVDEYKSKEKIDEPRDKEEISKGIRATQNMWAGLVAGFILLWIIFLPFILEVEWLGIGFVALFTLIPIVLGLFRKRFG